jgi:hypothetical protein
MKKLMIIALMLAFTLPVFSQVPTQDTTGKSTNKTMKRKYDKRSKMHRSQTDSMRRDTSATDTTRRNRPQ